MAFEIWTGPGTVIGVVGEGVFPSPGPAAAVPAGATTLGTITATTGRTQIVSTNAVTTGTEVLTIGSGGGAGLTQAGTANVTFGIGGYAAGTSALTNSILINNQATTTNTILSAEVDAWMKKLIKKSSLISGVNEKQRLQIFKKIKLKAETVLKKIESSEV